MDNKHVGELAEAIFQLRATQEGHIVSKPFGDSSKYDYIIDNGNRLLKIQIKSTFKPPFGKTGRKIMASYGARAKTAYREGDWDFICCYAHDIDTWWIIPFETMNGRVTLYLSNTGANAPYKEAWCLLKGEDACKTL